MKKAIQTALFGVLALSSLNACQTTQTSTDYSSRSALQPVLYELLENRERANAVLPILQEELNSSTADDWRIIRSIAKYYVKQKQDDLAFPFLLKKAMHDRADDDDAVELACAYWYGKGTPVDKTIAIEWLKKAAQKGSSEARLFLSSIYLEGLDGAVNPERGNYWKVRAYSAAQMRRYGDHHSPIDLEIADDLKYSDCPEHFESRAKSYREAALARDPNQFESLIEKYEDLESGESPKYDEMQDMLDSILAFQVRDAYIKAACFYEDKKNPRYSIEKAIYWYEQAAQTDTSHFYRADKLAQHLWSANHRVEAVFWYRYEADGYASARDARELEEHLDQLSEQEAKDFQILYENWAFNGKLPLINDEAL